MTEPTKPKYSFPIARFFLGLAGKARRNWLLRHQDPRNFWIHMIGIPLALAGIPLFFFVPWYWACAAIAAGYFLQWVGHRWEGNDVGEWAGIKRLLGLPTVAISPRFAKSAPSPSEQPTNPASFS